MTEIKNQLNLNIIHEVKNNGRLLSDVAKQYGLSTKVVYQLVRQSEQQPASRTIVLKSEITQLRNKIRRLTQELTLMTQ
ncbi:transposase [Shewanella sp. 10N.286.54.B9]|uniref:transposase n=1 Tax=Shewanella sp. 10N.286.54.B9 TaxID=3229719 RepID=UPI00354DE10A